MYEMTECPERREKGNEEDGVLSANRVFLSHFDGWVPRENKLPELVEYIRSGSALEQHCQD